MDMKDYLLYLGKSILTSAEKYSKGNKHKRGSIKQYVPQKPIYDKKCEEDVIVDEPIVSEEKVKEQPISNDLKQPKNEPRRDSDKEFVKMFRQIIGRYNSWQVWQDFVTIFACAISNAFDKVHYDKREELYLNIIKKYNERERNIFPSLAAEVTIALDNNPEQDFLGHLYMTLNLGSKEHQQIFTPYHVCDLMARITMDNLVKEVKEKGYISINDPCCGGGATLIAAINAAKKLLADENMNFQNHIMVVAQDIDHTVAMMCYIQLSLLGVAGYVKVGNALTEPIASTDELDDYWFTPMYFSNAWTTRRLFEKLDDITRKDE